MKLAQLAALIDTTYSGDGTVEIERVAELSSATEGSIALAMGRSAVAPTGASALIVGDAADAGSLPAIISFAPKKTFAKVLEILLPEKKPVTGLHPSAVVDDEAHIGTGVSIGAHSSIGAGSRIADEVIIGAGVRVGEGVVIGAATRLFDNVVLYEGVILGGQIRIHANTTIGADGYGYTPEPDKTHYKIPQRGTVVIGDNVEIGANCCIDRATLGETTIGAGTKIDNQVHIAHNCCIGQNVIIAGQSGIAGSTTIADNVVIGGAVAVSDHVEIGEGVMIAGFSGVPSSRFDPGVYSGPFAMKHRDYKKLMLSGSRLDKIEKLLRQKNKKESS